MSRTTFCGLMARPAGCTSATAGAVLVEDLRRSIDELLVRPRGCHQMHGADIESVEVLVLAAIRARWNRMLIKERVVGDEVSPSPRDRTERGGFAATSTPSGRSRPSAPRHREMRLRAEPSASMSTAPVWVLLRRREVVVGDAVGFHDGGDERFPAGAPRDRRRRAVRGCRRCCVCPIFRG